MRIVFIGSVILSSRILEYLLSSGAQIVGLCTLKESRFNADHVDLGELGNKYSIPVFYGGDINSPEAVSWVKEKSDKYWVLCDTETTGLPSDPYEVQLTQISCIVIKYDFESNTFKELGTYNKKLKLSEKTLGLMNDPSSRIKKVLSFT